MRAVAERRAAAWRVHGVTLQASSQAPALLAALERDFGDAAAPGGSADVRLTASLASCPLAPIAGGLRWRGCRFADRGPVRRLDYGGGAGGEWDFESEAGRLWAPEPALLHELSWLTLQSRLGAALDARGLHRVHALGFTWRGRGGLLLLPSGGGKTSLALALARRPEFALLSDDIPLLGADGRLRAFRQRLTLRGAVPAGVPAEALRPFPRRRFGSKLALDAGAYPGAWAEAAALDWVVVGAAGGACAAAAPCSWARAAAALASALVVGVGTPQVLELMLPGSLGRSAALAAVAAARTRAALGALARARRLSLSLGPDVAAAASALTAALDG